MPMSDVLIMEGNRYVFGVDIAFKNFGGSPAFGIRGQVVFIKDRSNIIKIQDEMKDYFDTVSPRQDYSGLDAFP